MDYKQMFSIAVSMMTDVQKKNLQREIRKNSGKIGSQKSRLRRKKNFKGYDPSKNPLLGPEKATESDQTPEMTPTTTQTQTASGEAL